MTTPLQVDCIAVVLAGLNASGITGRFGTRTPDDLAAELPFARLEPASSSDDNYALDQMSVQIDCFGTDEPTSRQFALAVAEAVRRLRAQVIGGAVVTYVKKDNGPVLQPYANPAVIRHVVTMRVTVKAA